MKNNILDYGEAVVQAITEYLGYPYEKETNKGTYIVQRGDTLYSIGRRFNISVDELKRINNLTSNILNIGQVLLLENIPSNENYVVQKGDTLYSISKNNNVSIEDIIEANNLTSNILTIGQELYIPKSQGEGNYDFPEDPTEDFVFYEVQRGDSLWLIANRYNITVKELIDINNLEDLTIQIGQQLLVPNMNKKEEFYTVEKNDTLWSIAKKYNLTVQELKEMNNLEDNMLYSGQQLIITK